MWATPQLLDRSLDDLSYGLHLLIGFNAVKVYHDGWMSAMGSVRALVVVAGDPTPGCPPAPVILFPRHTYRRIHTSRIASFNASTQKSASSVSDSRKASTFRVWRVHDGNQIEEATAHWDVSDFSASDLIGPFHAQSTQQIGGSLMPLRGPAGIGLLLDRYQAYKTHQSSNVLVVQHIALIAQVPCHLLNAIKRCL